MASAAMMLSVLGTWTVALSLMYRRSKPQNRGRGLLYVIPWLVLVAPVSYYRLGESVTAFTITAIAGALLTLFFTKATFDKILEEREKASTDEDGEASRAGVIIAALIIGIPIAILLILSIRSY